MVSKNRRFKIFLDKILLKIPILSRFIIYSELSRFTFMFSSLIKSGIPIAQAMKLSSSTFENLLFQNIFSKASHSLVEGKGIADSLIKNGFNYDMTFIQTIAVAEEIGIKEKIFLNLSRYYKEEENILIEKFLSLIEPVMMLVVGLFVGLIVIGMFLPLASISFNY